MKKLIGLIVLSLTTYCAISQTALVDSVTCIPNSILRNAIKQIETGKVVKEELLLTKKSVSLLQNSLTIKDSVIASYQRSEADYKNIYTNAKIQMIDLNSLIANERAIGKIYMLDARKQKKLKWVYAISGIAVGYFIVHK